MKTRTIAPVLTAGRYPAQITAINDVADFVATDGKIYTTNVEIEMNIHTAQGVLVPQKMRIINAFVELQPANGGNPYLPFNSFFANRIQRQAKQTFTDTAQLEAWCLANLIEVEVAIDSRGFTQLNVANPVPPVTQATAPVAPESASVEAFNLGSEE